MDREHEDYGGEIPDKGEIEGDVDMAAGADTDYCEDDSAPNSSSKDLEDMKKRLKEIDEEAGALRKLQAKVQDSCVTSATMAEKEEVDSHSIYVGNAVQSDDFPQEQRWLNRFSIVVSHYCSRLGSGPKNAYKDTDDGLRCFLLELEFVQCLANPGYIHYLAQNRYFEDEAFIGYLKYLRYWQCPEYLKFIMYPNCLFFLELLQNVNFCNAMAHPGNKELAHRQQFFFWKNYRNNRLKHITPRPLPEPPAAMPAPAPPQAPTTPMSATIAATAPHPPVFSPMRGMEFCVGHLLPKMT